MSKTEGKWVDTEKGKESVGVVILILKFREDISEHIVLSLRI